LYTKKNAVPIPYSETLSFVSSAETVISCASSVGFSSVFLFHHLL
jgi:hypothetical protein